MRPAGAAPPTRLALVGAGRFGAEVLEAAASMPEVECPVVADADEPAARALAAAHGCSALGPDGLDALLRPDGRAVDGLDDVDAVVVTTPPATHADLTRRALLAGLDVFCEKPIATTVEDAEDVTSLAESLGRVLVVDHLLRYNPLLMALRRVQQAMAWPVVRFLFENDAADESLPRGHWFWDEDVSGGIFVEHGVHFFDAASLFLDQPASAVTAVATSRPGWPAPDLVTVTATHGASLATYTHSFTHAHRCERQLVRIDFGAAEARVEGWIPVDAVIVAHTDAAGAERLRALADDPALLAGPGGEAVTEGLQPEVVVEVTEVDGPLVATGRGHAFAANRLLTLRLSLGGAPAKPAAYRAGIRAALRDLHRCRVDPSRRPWSGAPGATEAVRVAVHAAESARTGRTIAVRQRSLTADPKGRP